MTKKKIRFYITLYCLSALLAIGSLIINIQVISLNEHARITLDKLEKIKEVNEQLYREFLSKGSYESIYEYASQNLQMNPCISQTLICHAK